MSSIYGDSCIVLSAISTCNSDEGFLSPRDPFRHIQTRMPSNISSRMHLYLKYPQYQMANRILDSRAWTLQEVLLPPRVIHYSSTQIIFDCNTTTFQEDGGIEYWGNSKRLLVSNIFSKQLRWYSVIEEYSHRNLTFETDKLSAISGLARKIETEAGNSYIVGLWKDDLVAGLLWTAGSQDLSRIEKYTAPSWSWASTMGSICFRSCLNQHLEDDDLSVDIIDVNVQTLDGTAYSKVLSGKLRVSGYMRKLERNWIGGKDFINQTMSHSFSLSLSTTFPENTSTLTELPSNIQEVYRDEEDFRTRVRDRGNDLLTVQFQARFDSGKIPTTGEIWCLSFISPKSLDDKPRETSFCSDSLVPDGLLVSRINQSCNSFQRIGVFSMYDLPAVRSGGIFICRYSDWIFHAGAETMEIVIE
jgi:hypothetical protein